jgi:hypothetical protein
LAPSEASAILESGQAERDFPRRVDHVAAEEIARAERAAGFFSISLLTVVAPIFVVKITGTREPHRRTRRLQGTRSDRALERDF